MLRHTKAQKRDKELLRLLAKGEREIEAGEGYDLDSILADADALLAEESVVKIRFTPSAENSIPLCTYLHSVEIILRQRCAFVTEQRKSCADWKSSRNPAEWYPSSLSFPIGKSSFHLIDFSTESKEEVIWIVAVWHGAQLAQEPKA